MARGEGRVGSGAKPPAVRGRRETSSAAERPSQRSPSTVPAHATPLMAAMKLRDRLAGKKVVCVMSGGNIDQATLKRVLTAA